MKQLPVFVLSFILGSILFSSCAPAIKPISVLRRTYQSVPLNTVLKTEIGDELIISGEEDYQEALRIIKSPNFSINLTKYPHKEGDILPLSASTSQSDFYFDKKHLSYTDALYYGVMVSKKDRNNIRPFQSSNKNNIGGFYPRQVKGFEVKNDVYTNKNCENCFKQEIIYSGRIGNNLKFVYREYVNDMARSAFTQEMQYDLNESKIIGFKGVRIEVVNASNALIEYRVLNVFNGK